MFKIKSAIFLVLFFCAGTSALAQAIVRQVSSVDDLTTNALLSLSGVVAVHVESYHCAASSTCPADGGEGLFVNGGTSCTSDLGSVVKDATATPHCWYRQNLNGDIRQFGITAGSLYDVNIHHSPSDAAPVIINDVIPALLSAQIHTIHTGQVSIKLGKTIVLAAGWSLTCDTTPVKAAANADYTNVAGAIFLAHRNGFAPVFIDAQTNNDAEVYGCAAILPEWYINPGLAVTQFGGYTRSLIPATYSDLEAIRSNMILAGDYAVVAGKGAKIHDISILGFDNCIYAHDPAGFIGKNVTMDCSVGFYMTDNQGVATIKDFDVEPILTKQPNGLNSEEYWDITAIIPGGANPFGGHLCHVTVTALDNGHSLDLFPTSDIVNSATDASTGRGDPIYSPLWIAGFKGAAASCLSVGTGGFGNDAAWAVSGISYGTNGAGRSTATFDLVNSDFADVPIAYKADWSAGTGALRIQGPISNLVAGMKVTSSDSNWPGCSISTCATLTVTAVVARATGPDPNDGYEGEVIVSPAPPKASSSTAVAVTFSNDGSSYVDSSPCDLTGHGNCAYLNASERYMAGTSLAGLASARLPASRGGRLGAGILIDDVAGLRAVNTFTFGHYYNVAAIDSGTCDFLQVKGDDNHELNPGNGIGIYLTGGSRGCAFVTQGPGQSGAGIVQDTFGLQDDPTGMLNTTANGMSSLSDYHPGTGSITFTGSIPTGWPSIGTMHVCQAASSSACDTSQTNEYVSYHVVLPSTISIDARGRFGTLPKPFAAGAVNIYSVVVNNGSTKHEDKSASSVFSDMSDTSSNNTSNQFEIHHGSATFSNVHAEVSGNAYVSTNTSGVTITAADMDKVSLYFEDQNARALTTVTPDSDFANYVAPGAVNHPLSYRQWFGSPQAATGLVALGDYQVGTLTVQSTRNWPTTGVLLIDSEYMAYHVVNTGSLSVDQRGMCGSLAVSHADAIVTYMNVMFGCPSTGEGNPQFAIDGSGNVSFAQSALSHGQVYMNLDASNNIQLCPKNGKGLIIAGIMRAVPTTCAIVPPGQTTISSINYVYAAFHQIAVTSIVSHTGYIRLFVNDNSGFYTNSPITCFGTGIPTANVVEYNHTTPGSGFIDLPLISYPPNPPPAGTDNGGCSYVSLEFSGTSHATGSNGVEILGGMTPDPTKTLVGVVYADASHGVVDDALHRDVASWFNRKSKICLATWSSDGQYIGSSIGELKIFPSTPLHCQFVAWDQDVVDWSFFGMANDNAPAEVALVAAGFDSTTTPTTERVQFRETAIGQRYPLGLPGRISFVGDSLHYITMLGQASLTSAVTVYATGGESVRIPQ